MDRRKIGCIKERQDGLKNNKKDKRKIGSIKGRQDGQRGRERKAVRKCHRKRENKINRDRGRRLKVLVTMHAVAKCLNLNTYRFDFYKQMEAFLYSVLLPLSTTPVTSSNIYRNSSDCRTCASGVCQGKTSCYRDGKLPSYLQLLYGIQFPLSKTDTEEKMKEDKIR